MDSGAPEYSAPTPLAFEMVRVDASRRVTSSAETETPFSLADAFFFGAMGFCLVFALVAISKCLEEFKDEQRHAFKIDHVIVPLPRGHIPLLPHTYNVHCIDHYPSLIILVVAKPVGAVALM
jgi:hypothetical protein